MIVEPFAFDGYDAKDIQDVAPTEQYQIAAALRDGMALIPEAYKCGALGVTPDGDYVSMRLGVYHAGALIGAWWIGAHEAAPGHTTDHAKVYSRLCPGPVPGHEGEFWVAASALLFVKHLLGNVLATRAGGTMQLVGIDYAFCPALLPQSPEYILHDIDALAAEDATLHVTRTDLGAGVIDNRWTLAP